MADYLKPRITDDGYETAVKDYSELTVVEEIVANSYDAGAKKILVVVNPQVTPSKILDDGEGFNKKQFVMLWSSAAELSTRMFSILHHRGITLELTALG